MGTPAAAIAVPNVCRRSWKLPGQTSGLKGCLQAGQDRRLLQRLAGRVGEGQLAVARFAAQPVIAVERASNGVGHRHAAE
jgi:hypothetical protein